MSGTLSRHLVVMARAPRLGAVKRRLVRDIGALEALRFYRQTTDALLRRLGGDPRWITWLAVTPDRSADTARHAWNFSGPVIGQGAGDLGARMGRILCRLPPGPVVIVGSDIPGIAPRHVAAAFVELGRRGWVFGPAWDGGYWLIGARRRPAVTLPFAGVRWSSEHALADTLANLTRRGLQPGAIGYLEKLDDIDDGVALRRWRNSQAKTST